MRFFLASIQVGKNHLRKMCGDPGRRFHIAQRSERSRAFARRKPKGIRPDPINAGHEEGRSNRDLRARGTCGDDRGACRAPSRNLRASRCLMNRLRAPDPYRRAWTRPSPPRFPATCIDGKNISMMGSFRRKSETPSHAGKNDAGTGSGKRFRARLLFRLGNCGFFVTLADFGVDGSKTDVVRRLMQ